MMVGVIDEANLRMSEKRSNNFIIVAGKERTFGVFFDDQAWFSFDLGFSDPDMAVMTSRYGDLAVYIIEGDGLNAIAKEFRRLIGRSYLPPKWAFGFIQSRFGGISGESVNEASPCSAPSPKGEGFVPSNDPLYKKEVSSMETRKLYYEDTHPDRKSVV